MNEPSAALAPHQQRVIEERAELDERIGKLTAFLATKTYDGLDCNEQFDLHEQLTHMERYSAVLGRRIAGWTTS